MLNPKLEEILNELKNTPIDEPKIAKALEAVPLKKSKVIKLILKDSELNMNDFEAKEIAEFYKAVVSKIMNMKNTDGVFKSTPKTENLRLPNFEEVEDIIELLTNVHAQRTIQNDLQQEVIDGKQIDPEAMKNSVIESTRLLKDMEKLTWKVSKLNKKDLSDWEALLVSEQLVSCASDVTKTSVGKQ